MYEAMKLSRTIKGPEQTFDKFPEHRTGKNSQYEFADAGMGHFQYFLRKVRHFWHASEI